jgi:hypothetical protein
MSREDELVRNISDSGKGRPAWVEPKRWCVIVRKGDLHERRGELVCDSEEGRPAWAERKSWWGLLVMRKEDLYEQRGRTGED